MEARKKIKSEKIKKGEVFTLRLFYIPQEVEVILNEL